MTAIVEKVNRQFNLARGYWTGQKIAGLTLNSDLAPAVQRQFQDATLEHLGRPVGIFARQPSRSNRTAKII